MKEPKEKRTFKAALKDAWTDWIGIMIFGFIMSAVVLYVLLGMIDCVGGLAD